MFANKSHVPQIVCNVYNLLGQQSQKSNMKSSSKNVFKYSSEVDLKYDTSGKVDVENDGVNEEEERVKRVRM